MAKYLCLKGQTGPMKS